MIRSRHVSERPERPASATPSGREPDAVPSEAILGDRSEIVIEHHGSRYVLRVTRQDRLILNKWGGTDHE